MNFFWKKQKAIEDMLRKYILETDTCAEDFLKSFKHYLSGGEDEQFEQLVMAAHTHESRADDTRRDIERELYSKALLPESRGDFLGALEAFDQILNKMESVLYQILLERIGLKEEYGDELARLVNINLEAYHITRDTFMSLFEDLKQAPEHAKKVDAKESESDRIERSLIKKIFASSLDGTDKILLKDLVLEIGAISDLAEDVADRIALIALKRQV